MSTVVYKDGKMVSDSRSFSGSPHPIGSRQKIWRHNNGLFAICAGTHGESSQVRDHLTNLISLTGMHSIMLPFHFGGQVLTVNKRNEKEYDVHYLSGGQSFVGPLSAPFFTIGSGAQYAYGALAAGATPEEAVKIAIEADIYSGGDLQILEL